MLGFGVYKISLTYASFKAFFIQIDLCINTLHFVMYIIDFFNESFLISWLFIQSKVVFLQYEIDV